MPKLKVKPLEWYMERDHEDLIEDFTPLSEDYLLLGRDGFYCLNDLVWFEVNGVGYHAYNFSLSKHREHFCYTLTVNDEAILPEREARAIEEVLKTSRDASVKKALRARLHLHNQAWHLRNTYREALLDGCSRIKNLVKW
jgi:hypothetical protein